MNRIESALLSELRYQARIRSTDDGAGGHPAYFEPRDHTGKYQCPRCWVRNSKASPMRPVPSNSRDDVFVCEVCNGEVVVAG